MSYTPTLSRRSALGLIAAVPVTLAAPTVLRPAYAMAPATYVEGGIAIDGSDVMGYWLEGKPVAGSPGAMLRKSASRAARLRVLFSWTG